MTFPTRVRHVQDGQPVAAGITARATQDLEKQTTFLNNVIEAMENGRALVHRGATLEAGALVGQPVFWNAVEQRYERARATVETNSATGSLQSALSADALGLVLRKDSSTLGDVVLAGLVEFENLANAVDETLTPGRYYLSSAFAGKLVAQRPPVSVPMCYVYGPLTACEEHVWVDVMPQMRDFLEDHIHYQVELTARPAGDHTPPLSDRHEILNPDATLRGWLPADHESFNGMAPAGARFGYNLAAHTELSRIWPPIPLGACLLEVFDPDVAGTTEGMGRAPQELIRFTHYGIWWMSDCYGEVPWPVDYVSPSSSSIAAPSSSSSEGVQCPLPIVMRLILSFIKMTFATDKSVVTSLQPGTEQPIEFVNCDGVAANTGDLYAQLRLEFFYDDAEFYGGQVLKEITTGFKFGRGWAAEGLIAGSEYVQLTSTHQRYATPDDDETNLVHQGLITVDFIADPTERELLPQIVRLGDAVERVYHDAPYIGFPSGRDSAIRIRFNIPYAGLPTTPQFKLRCQLLALTAGNFPEMTASYYRLARASPEAVELGEGDTDLTEFDTMLTGVEQDHVYEVESELFTVAAGDTLFVTIQRAHDATPAYADDVGFLRISGIVAAAVT